MNVTVWDEDITCSDKVGTTVIKISSLTANGGIDDWFPIQYKGKQSGQIHLKGVWTPNDQSAKATAAQQPQMGMLGGLGG